MQQGNLTLKLKQIRCIPIQILIIQTVITQHYIQVWCEARVTFLAYSLILSLDRLCTGSTFSIPYVSTRYDHSFRCENAPPKALTTTCNACLGDVNKKQVLPFIPLRSHPSFLLWLCIRFHDTGLNSHIHGTRHTGAVEPGCCTIS